VSLLSHQDEDVRARWTTLPEFAIITVLLSMLHERKQSRVQVGDFSEFVNVALRARGEILEYSPEEVGHRLAAMRIFTSRTGSGKVIRITREISRLAHDLKLRYGIATSPGSFPGCPDCERTEVPGKKGLV